MTHRSFDWLRKQIRFLCAQSCAHGYDLCTLQLLYSKGPLECLLQVAAHTISFHVRRFCHAPLRPCYSRCFLFCVFPGSLLLVSVDLVICLWSLVVCSVPHALPPTISACPVGPNGTMPRLGRPPLLRFAQVGRTRALRIYTYVYVCVFARGMRVSHKYCCRHGR